MSTPHRHHFIPAFYLRQWHGPDNKLVEYSIRRGKPIPKSVSAESTGFERDLYAFPELASDQAQWMEQKFFDYADRTASQALGMLLEGHPKELWADEMLSAWARFLVGVHTRHPDALPELKAHARAKLDSRPEELQRIYEGIREPGGPSTFAEWIATRDPMAPHRFTLELIMGAIDNEFIGKRLIEMHWGIIDVSPTPRRLVTSDRPVAFYLLNHPEGSVTMPISPAKLFVAVNDKQYIDRARFKKPREVVDAINLDNIRRARRYVWALGEPRWQMAVLRNHMSERMEKLPLFSLLSEKATSAITE